MTNERDPNLPPEADDASVQGNASQEAESTVWDDNRPPHDDFSDAAMTAEEDMPNVSHEAAMDIEDNTMPAPPARSKLPIFAGLGGLLILGAIVFWQFGQSSPVSPTTAPNASHMPMVPMAVQNPTAPPSPAPVASGNADQKDINALKAAAPAVPPAVPPSATAMPAAETISSTTPPATPPTAAEVKAGIISPTVESAGNAPALPAPAVSPKGTPQVPVTLPPAVVNAAPAGASQERIDALSARIDELQKLLDQTTKQLSQVSNMVAAQIPAASASATPPVEDRLNKIEQNLAMLEHHQETEAAPTTKAKPEKSTSAKPATKPAVKKNAAKKTKTAAHAVAANKASSKVAAAKKSAEKTAAAQKWVLRAATPSEAWVSANATSPELRHVRVGEVLPGIGKIRAIRQSENGWLVEGTEGTVR